MPNYNPHAPQVLGQEWAPINQHNYTPDDVTERGYRFTLAVPTPATLTGGSFTVAGPPTFSPRHTAQVVAIYPAGTTDQSGPIRQNTATPEVNTTVRSGGFTLVGGATDVADALRNPSDGKGLRFKNTTTWQDIDFFFDFGLGPFSGRRILTVEVDYQLQYPATLAPDAPAGALKPYTQFSYLRTNNTAQRLVFAPSPEDASPDAVQIRTAHLGELCFFWDAATVADTRTEIMPWTDRALGWFRSTSSSTQRLAINLFSGLTSTPIVGELLLGYLAIRVRHGVETRIRVGGMHRRAAVAGYSPVAPGPPLGSGTQYVSLRDITTVAPFWDKTVLPAGTYDITTYNVYSPDNLTEPLASPGTPPPMAGLRQLDGLPVAGVDTLFGLLVKRTATVGDIFQTEMTDVLVPLTLGYGTGPTNPVTQTHPYADRVAASVHGAVNVVTQRLDTSVATGLAYRQVTFIARRMSTASPGANLVVASVQTPAATATLTPAALDALPEIIDGWRKVTLTLAVPLTIAAASTQDIRWTASAATEGMQWQILGTRGKLMTAVNPGDITWNIGAASYGGSTAIRATWRPDDGPMQAADELGDAYVVLSAEPAAVTGLTATVQQLAVPNDTALDLCDSGMCCIPTEIAYVRVTWTPTTLAAAQFGEYRLQRKNPHTGVYETIMVGTTPALAVFDDYEIRVGLNEYRMQLVDAAGVVALTQPLASVTVAAPGITTGCGSTAGLLAITSNSAASAGVSALAYKMIWPNDPEETFTFPEGERVEYQEMYQRDYTVAFHDTERGGERFTRDLLIAQDLPVGQPGQALVMGNFQRLRDLCWADLPYLCVRDEQGNRWFASVSVPEGVISRVGKAYVAKDVYFVQTNITPAPVIRP